jgi:hypothetical protein
LTIDCIKRDLENIISLYLLKYIVFTTRWKLKF